MLRIFALLTCFLYVACTPCCPYHYCMQGASEFVIDSYRIREGKYGILEFEGIDIPCLPEHYLFEYEDQIDEDDVLEIVIYHPTRKEITETAARIGATVGFRVINGKIQLPELPPLVVKGLTLEHAKQTIQSLYDAEMMNVEVFLDYKRRLHSKVDIIGAVKVPEIPVNGRIRLYEVLSLAIIHPEANLFKSYVSRDCEVLPIDLYKLIHEGDMCQNIVMRPRDKIFIANPSDSTVTVLGEVGFAQVIPVPYGSISLREALALAGGIPFTGDKRCIQVIRGSIINPKIYRLSWNHIVHLPNDSLLLMPGDTVYISEKPITKWNRFIEQLLPSSLLIDLGIKTRGVFK